MPAITLDEAKAQLAAYLAAERKILAGQSVQIGDETLTRADLRAVQQGVSVWSARVNEISALSRGRVRARTLVRVDA
jgi:hypothetical protein